MNKITILVHPWEWQTIEHTILDEFPNANIIRAEDGKVKFEVIDNKLKENKWYSLEDVHTVGYYDGNIRLYEVRLILTKHL